MFGHGEMQENAQNWMSCMVNAAMTNLCFCRAMARSDTTLRDIFEERNAMILGMNPKELRKPRLWCVHLWLRKKRHWAIVLQPVGDSFQARIVDDFVYNARHCYNAELPSTHLFLVYELFADAAEPYLMLSAKPDFDPEHRQVRSLGIVGPVCFHEVQTKALSIIRRFRHYSCIGANCQHFAVEFAAALGVTDCDTLTPDDEAIAKYASESAGAICITSSVVGVTAAAGAAVLSVSAPPVLPVTAPVILKGVAASATGISVLGSIAFIGVVGGYHTLHASLRKDFDESSSNAKASKCHALADLEHRRTASEDEPASEPPTRKMSWLEDGTPLPTDLEHQEAASDEEPECEMYLSSTCAATEDSFRKRLFDHWLTPR
jgi:hypothetical protein